MSGFVSLSQTPVFEQHNVSVVSCSRLTAHVHGVADGTAAACFSVRGLATLTWRGMARRKYNRCTTGVQQVYSVFNICCTCAAKSCAPLAWASCQRKAPLGMKTLQHCTLCCACAAFSTAVCAEEPPLDDAWCLPLYALAGVLAGLLPDRSHKGSSPAIMHSAQRPQLCSPAPKPLGLLALAGVGGNM